MKYLNNNVEIVPGCVGIRECSNFSLLRIVDGIEETVQRGCKHQWVLSFGSEFMVYVCERCYEVKPCADKIGSRKRILQSKPAKKAKTKERYSLLRSRVTKSFKN